MEKHTVGSILVTNKARFISAMLQNCENIERSRY